jgi:heme A synthase
MAWLHRLAVVLAGATFVLVLLGTLVTSTGAGLSVQTWPSTFTGLDAPGAGLQQAHRVVASMVGLLALLVAIAAWRVDPRAWMRGLALGMLALGTAQAVYGGIGVLNLLPAFISVFHAALAQLFLALTVGIALFTSPGWLERAGQAGEETDRSLRRWAVGAVGVIYLQVVIGAAMRHTYGADGRPAGFAIPDFPLAFGGLLPPARMVSWAVALDVLHRLTALAAVLLVAVSAVRVYRRHPTEEELVRPAALLALVLFAQVALGGLTVLSGGSPALSASHAVAVAVALSAALVLAFRSALPGVTAGAAPPIEPGRLSR